MFNKIILFFLLVFFSVNELSAQPIYPEASKQKRTKLLYYLNDVIQKNLSFPLEKIHEEKWISAFYPLQLLQKRNEWIDSRISLALQSWNERSPEFQHALLELVFSNYRKEFQKEIRKCLQSTSDTIAFAIAAEYIVREAKDPITLKWISYYYKKLKLNNKSTPFINEIGSSVFSNVPYRNSFSEIIQPGYLPNEVLMISFQRKNRDYPGITVIRDTSGNLLTDSLGEIWHVQQLARSISGLPYYMYGGNTPQGIFRMYGYGFSKSNFIGPTKNIQLSIPFEFTTAHFMHDSDYVNSSMNMETYQKLLPPSIRHYTPLYESYYAGFLGRNEMIAHGTAVDIEWYNNKSYYPFTPTMGCLTTKEVWDENGKLIISDQQLLTEAIERAGGPHGYAIVINIDDQHTPVTMLEVLRILNKNP